MSSSALFPYSLLFLAMSSTYAGSTPALSPATELDEVIVVGTRTKGMLKTNPHSVTVVSGKKIDRTPVSSVAELLQDSPGVEVTDANSAGTRRVRIRGEDSRRVTILIDGQELTDHSTYGTPILENNSNIERIEVVHGPASVLYGAKAIGGVVNIVTKEGGGGKPINGELAMSYFGGSNGQLWNAAVWGAIGDFAYRLAGYKEFHHDIHVAPSEWSVGLNRLFHTQTHDSGVNLVLGYRLGDQRNHLLHLKLEDSKLSAENWREPGILTSSFIPLDLFDINLPERSKRKVGFYYEGEDLGSVLHKIHADVYYQRVNRAFANRLVSPLFHTDAFIMKTVEGNIPSFIEHQIPTIRQALYPILEPFRFNMSNLSKDRLINYGGTVQLDFTLPYHNYFITGVNYLSDHLQTDKTTDMLMTGLPVPKPLIDLHWAPAEVHHHVAGDYKAHINTVSLFVQDEWQATPDLKFTAGLRHYRINTHLDHSSQQHHLGQKENHTLKSASLVYTGLKHTALRIGYSEGYISPNMMQLFVPTDAGGIASLPNPNLKSETAKNWETGIRYNEGAFTLEGTLFTTEAKNYISLRSCRHNDNPLCASNSKFRASAVYENMDHASTRGLELSSAYQFFNGVEPYFSLTYMRRQERLNGRDTYDTNVPKYFARLGVRYQDQAGKIPFWVDGFMRASSRVTLAPELNPSYPGGDIPMKPLSGWATLNIAAGVSSKLAGNTKIDITAQVNNLTNKAYRSSFSALPGEARNLSLTTRWRF